MLGLGAAASAQPLAVTTIVAYRSGSALIRRSAVSLLAARADQLAGDLDAFHTGFRRAAARLSALPAVKEFCTLPLPARREAESGMEAWLGAYAGADSRTHLVALFDREGTITAATIPGVRGRNYGYRRYFQSALAGEPTVSDLFISVAEAGGIPTIAYAAPIRNAAGEVMCVSLLVARGQEFWDLVAEKRGGAGPGSYAVVYDQYGIRIAHSYRGADLFHPAGPLDAATIAMFAADRRFGDNTRQLLESPVPMEEEFSRARNAAPSEFRTPASADGVVDLGVGRRLRTVPWTLFYLAPEPTVFAPVHQLVREILSANGLILGLTALAGLILARRITGPVRALTSAARTVRGGDLDVNVDVRSADELGELASAFNSMAASLRAARDGLEEKVRLRTEALKAANESLEAQNRVLAERTAELTARQQRDLAHARVLTTLSGEGALAPVVDAALRDAATFTGAVVATCYRVLGSSLVPLAGPGTTAGASVPLAGAVQEAFRTRRAILLDSVPAGVELRFEAALAAGRPTCIVLVPLIIGQRNIGLLAAGALKPFDAAAVTFLSDLALPLALTIVRHDLHRQTGEFAEQLAKSNEELQLQTEELQAQGRDLQAKNLEVQKADKLKSEFLANMSHELRTPLNAIIGFSELLLDEGRPGLSGEHVKFVETVLASGRHLLELINDILDLAKIESGRVELQLEPLAPDASIREAVELITPQAQRKRIGIRTRIETARAVLADRGKLRQILLNLLSNAVKFSAENSAVEIGAEDVPSAVRFRVRDEGPGIDDALMPRLFEPFVQGDSALIKKHQGTGLGLAISKRLAGEHGGTIAVASAPGTGTTFFVTIPAAAAPVPSPSPPQPMPGRKPTVDTAGGHPLVLLVEDDVATVRLIRAYLGDTGYELVEATNSSNAMDLARRVQPAVILLDLDLDGEDGLELLQALKADAQTRHIPVIIESVLAEQKRGLLLGASDYHVKPLDRSRLLESIARLGPAGLSRAEEPLVLAIDDDPVVETTLRSVLDPAGFRLKTAALGREGIEIARREGPAVIMVDLLLPDISGFEVIDALGADPRTATVPVIALTAASLSPADRKRLETRVFSLAQKDDFTRYALVAAVRRAVQLGPVTCHANGPTVLVVDDYDLNRELIRTMLERKGYRVLLAESGDEGIEISRRERPSLVLLDLAMPGKDGFATARELKADESLASTPLVAVTAMAMRGDDQRAKEAGFDAYVTKPLDRGILEATVERLLRKPV